MTSSSSSSKTFSWSLCETVQSMSPSGIREFFEMVLGVKDVVSLGVGEPDFVTPWPVREKAIASLEEGFTSYTSNKGMIALRRAIARFLKHRYGLKYDPEDEILITVGVSEGLDVAMRAILNPGDQVIVPRPCYVSYVPVVTLAGGRPVALDVGAREGFRVTPAALEAAVRGAGGKVKAVMFNHPCNPTGVTYTREDLRALAAVIKRHNLCVISDEVYDELTYDGEHIPWPALPGMRQRVLYLNGFSKAYAMTGFRLGYACGPKPVIAAMTKIHQYTMLCAPITAQMAAVEALKDRASVAAMKRSYNQRRRLLIERLRGMGFDCVRPQGAFYLFASIAFTGMSSLEFAQELLRRQKVAVVPGPAFGPTGEGYIRLSYSSSLEDIREALRRIEGFLEGMNARQRSPRRAAGRDRGTHGS